MPSPVRYTSDVEAVLPDEGQTIEQLNQTFDKILNRVAEHSSHAVRSVHAKSQSYGFRPFSDIRKVCLPAV